MAPARTRPRRFGDRWNEKGYILALSALLMIPLFAFTGFATDVGAWYARASRLQRVADAASLAGVPWQPNFDQARATAREVALRNGLEDGKDGIEIEYINVGPRQFRVEITDTEVETYFASVFFDEIDIERGATAEYLQSLPMGSPDNRMGNDPINPQSPTPNLWAVIGGHDTDKIQGDQYHSGACGGSAVAGGITSGCTGTADFGDNADYRVEGYTYTVKVDQVQAGQPLRIQVYDPAHTSINGGGYNSSNFCNNWPGMSSSQRQNLANQSETSMNDANSRYADGATSYCLGDVLYSSGEEIMDTSFIVRGPDDTSFDSLDNPVIDTSECRPRTFSGREIRGTDIYERLLPTSSYNNYWEQGYEQVPFNQHFRQWFTLCTIPAGQVQPGEYVVQVRTNAELSGYPSNLATAGATNLVNEDPSVDTGGQNRYSFRAGWGSSGVPSSTNIGVSADGRLPIFVNSNTSVSTFYVARIAPEYAGEVILLSLFDIGDTSGTVDISVRPPADSNYSSFSGCTVIRDGNPNYTPPVSNCGVAGMNSNTYQGRTTAIQVPIPSNYTCNEAARSGCWMRMRMDFGSTAPNDTTTWTAAVLGDPVRLVE